MDAAVSGVVSVTRLSDGQLFSIGSDTSTQSFLTFMRGGGGVSASAVPVASPSDDGESSSDESSFTLASDDGDDKALAGPPGSSSAMGGGVPTSAPPPLPLFTTLLSSVELVTLAGQGGALKAKPSLALALELLKQIKVVPCIKTFPGNVADPSYSGGTVFFKNHTSSLSSKYITDAPLSLRASAWADLKNCGVRHLRERPGSGELMAYHTSFFHHHIAHFDASGTRAAAKGVINATTDGSSSFIEIILKSVGIIASVEVFAGTMVVFPGALLGMSSIQWAPPSRVKHAVKLPEGVWRVALQIRLEGECGENGLPVGIEFPDSMPLPHITLRGLGDTRPKVDAWTSGYTPSSPFRLHLIGSARLRLSRFTYNGFVIPGGNPNPPPGSVNARADEDTKKGGDKFPWSPSLLLEAMAQHAALDLDAQQRRLSEEAEHYMRRASGNDNYPISGLFGSANFPQDHTPTFSLGKILQNRHRPASTLGLALRVHPLSSYTPAGEGVGGTLAEELTWATQVGHAMALLGDMQQRRLHDTADHEPSPHQASFYPHGVPEYGLFARSSALQPKTCTYTLGKWVVGKTPPTVAIQTVIPALHPYLPSPPSDQWTQGKEWKEWQGAVINRVAMHQDENQQKLGWTSTHPGNKTSTRGVATSHNPRGLDSVGEVSVHNPRTGRFSLTASLQPQNPFATMGFPITRNPFKIMQIVAPLPSKVLNPDQE